MPDQGAGCPGGGWGQPDLTTEAREWFPSYRLALHEVQLMPQTTEEPTTRQVVLKAALAVFSAKGYAATTLEDVGQAAGVTRGALHEHFPDKRELYNTLVGEAWARSEEVVRQAIAEEGTFLEVCHRLLVRWLEYLESNDDFRAVLELTQFKTGLTPELQQGVRVKVEAVRRRVEGIATFIRRGIASGEVRRDLDPVAAARAYYAFRNGIATLWLLDREAFSMKASASALAEVFVRGIAARP